MNLKHKMAPVVETLFVVGTIAMLFSPLLTLLGLISIGVTIAVLIGT